MTIGHLNLPLSGLHGGYAMYDGISGTLHLRDPFGWTLPSISK